MASALRADGCVVTESEYVALGIKQTVTRAVEGPEGNRYHVTNTMTLPRDGGVLVAHSYFDRIEEEDDNGKGAGGNGAAGEAYPPG